MKYYIYAPSYDENSGGCIVLHRLCHLINEIDGCQAYLVPFVPERLSINNFSSFIMDSKRALKWLFTDCFIKSRFKTNEHWNTPIQFKHEIKDIDHAVVVYPEVTYGNPLNAKNVVRWFLHQPGYFTKQLFFGANELYFKFNDAIKEFKYCLSTLSEQELKVVYYPLEYYNMQDVKDKNGCCYLVRKGKDKVKCHPDDAIPIDGLSHTKIAEIFKKSKRFISYDEYTAYSLFAVLCGCESIVVPNKGTSKEQWYPNPKNRYGIAYGFSAEEIAYANESKHKVLEYILNEHGRSYENVAQFIKETKLHFM